MTEQNRYGKIEKYDPHRKTGVILDSNGRRLHFRLKNFKDTIEPAKGMNVSFVMPLSPNQQGNVEITNIAMIDDLDAFMQELRIKQEKELLERAAEEALRLKRERQQAEKVEAARKTEIEKQRKRLEEDQTARREAYRIQQERQKDWLREQERFNTNKERQQHEEQESIRIESERHLADLTKRFPVGSRVFFPKQGRGTIKQIKGNMIAVLFDAQNGGNPIWVPADLLEPGQDTPSTAKSKTPRTQPSNEPVSRGSQLSNYLLEMRAEVLQVLAEEGVGYSDIYIHDPSEDPSTPPQEINIDSRIANVFSARGISRFYSHQVKAREAMLQGKNVIIATPTASGKTEAYNPTILEALLKEPDSTALYVFPLVALGLDQTERLQELNQSLQYKDRIEIGIYNGSVSNEVKKRTLRGNNRILVTTPESLHYIFLPKSQANWKNFFRNLRYIVVDEAHVYKGVFGANMANIIRRVLARCGREGNLRFPQVIVSSATIRDPAKLAEQLTGVKAKTFEVITESGAPKPERHFLVTRSDIHDITSLCSDLLSIKSSSSNNNGRQHISTIVFLRSINEVKTSARNLREHLSRVGRSDQRHLVDEFYSDKGDKVDVLKRLKDEKVRCLFTTTALMAGIDIGSLDVAIVKHFPGLVMDARQMFGRAGRTNEGAVIFVANRTDPFDQFYFERPEQLFQGQVEDVVANPENPMLLAAHLKCAAQTVAQYNKEGPLSNQWAYLFGRMGKDLLDHLVEQGSLRFERGDYSLTSENDPHDLEPLNNLRSISSEAYSLINAVDNQVLEEKRESTAFRDAHRDAIVSVNGGSYKVVDFNKANRKIKCVPLNNLEMRTRGMEELSVTVVSVDPENQPLILGSGAKIISGEILITTSVQNYILYKSRLVMQCRSRSCRRETPDLETRHCANCGSSVRPKQVEEIVDEFPIPTPPVLKRELKTRSSWIDFPVTVNEKFNNEFWPRWVVDGSENGAAFKLDFETALHSVEHAVLKAFPEYIPCDRDEIGGVYRFDKNLPGKLFIYDNFQGGLGLSDEFFHDPQTILEGALNIIERCNCIDDQGCPVCISYFGCHNFNKALSKLAGRYLLNTMLRKSTTKVLEDLREYVEYNIPIDMRIYGNEQNF